MFPFLDALFPVVVGILQRFVDVDEVGREVLLLLRDCAEMQLPRLPLTTCRHLYHCVVMTIKGVGEGIRRDPLCLSLAAAKKSSLNSGGNSSGGWGMSDGVATEGDILSVQSDQVLLILQLLNHLTTKDFLLDDEDKGYIITGLEQRSFEEQVASVLLQGLYLLIPLLTEQVLSSFPKTCERYFSFLALLVSSYESALVQLVRQSGVEVVGVGVGVELFSSLVQQMVWAAAAVDSVSAKKALQVGSVPFRSLSVLLCFSLYLF